MAGAALFALHDEGRAIREDLPHEGLVAADHRNDVIGLEPLGGGKRKRQHGSARDRMQDLGEPGLHAGALARGQHHSGQGS